VWLSLMVTLGSLLLFIIYTFAGINATLLLFLMHLTELLLFGLLLWRVETLPNLTESLTPSPSPSGEGSIYSQDGITAEEVTATPSNRRGAGGGVLGSTINIDLVQIEQLLAKHCVDTQLYLQDDLNLQQLAQAVGTNRYYLGQYFSRQGITYNTYINNLRINHFISRCQEAAQAGQTIVAQQLASECGFRTYRTFSRAFMLRTGQSVTEWMRDTGGITS